MLPVSQIKPTVEETWAGIKEMCKEIESEFPVQPDESQNEIDEWNDVIQSYP